MTTQQFLSLSSEEKETIDIFAFAQWLLERGGDVERRFALLSLDLSTEHVLRAYLKLDLENHFAHLNPQKEE